MADLVLLDTGFLVATVNARDPQHAQCVAVTERLRARLVTVEGVLVETAFVLRRHSTALANAARLLERWTVTLLPGTLERFGVALELMRRYHRMDLVDGLLVAAAETLGTTRILTLDRRDFSVYRLSGGRAFDIIE